MASRVLHSLRNVTVIWVGQAVSVLCTFVVRMAFVRVLPMDYLGIETLFSNVLSMLALAELGVASAIVFSLYAPLAKGEIGAIKSIMRLFKRAYLVIGFVVIGVGCALAPNIEFFIGGEAPDIPGLKWYFLIFVLNTGISYFFSYKGSLISADQKNYIVALIRYGFQILLCGLQITVLLVTGDYWLFLSCMLVCTLLMNITTACVANRLYPFLKDRDIDPIDSETLATIKKNILGMMVHKTSSVANAPVNSIILSKIAGLSSLALYGNYLLVINSLSRIVDQMFDAVVASIGNMNVVESRDRQYEVFRVMHFANAFLYGPLTVCFVSLANIFVVLAFGEDYLFSLPTVVLFAVWFYFRGMRDAVLSFISAYGLYWQTKFKAFLETVFLVVTVSLLTFFFGVNGLIIANIVVQIFISTTIEAYKMFKYGLKRSALPYFAFVAKYAIATALLSFLAYSVVNAVVIDSALLHFVVGGVVSVLIGFGGFSAIFWRTNEFAEVRHAVRSVYKGKFGK